MNSNRKINHQVRWIVAQIHVGTSYVEVAQNIADRYDRHNPKPPPERSFKARAITDALIQHRRNRLDYERIMG